MGKSPSPDMYDAYGHEQAPEYEETDGSSALNLSWVMGFNKDIDNGVQNLTSDGRHEIFYSAAHTGVIYDYARKTQRLLQGHCNKITAVASSEDKRWIVTADGGDDSMLIVWDSYSATPVRTFLNPHPNGIKCVDLSADNQYLVTLGNDEPQTISLWDWTNTKEEGPIVSMQFKYTKEFQNQHWVKFNPKNPTEIASNGTLRVLFLNWEPGVAKFQYHAPRAEKKDFQDRNKTAAKFTKTVFIPGRDTAVTGTDMGLILVWDRSLIIEGIGEQNEKRLIKIVTLNNLGASINSLSIAHDKYLVCGNSDGTIRFYDFHFKLVAWFEDLYLSGVKSISFSNTEPQPASQDPHKDEDPFFCSDFLVADESALVCMLQSHIFEEINPAKKKGFTLLSGIQSGISALAVHPTQPILAIAGAEGFILLWDYLKRGDPVSNYENFRKEELMAKNNDGRIFTAIEFTPDGEELLIAQFDGNIKVMDARTGTFLKLTTPLKTSERKGHSVKQLIVSHDGKYFATCDTNRCVCLFKKDHLQGDPSRPVEWQFNGKVLSHEIGVASIAFGQGLDEQGNPIHRLFSVGKDRRMFEYDVYKSQAHDKLVVISQFKIEQEAQPSACIWYPKRDSKEGLLLTANDEYKMKVWNPSA
jgi:WD40 repeat protein